MASLDLRKPWVRRAVVLGLLAVLLVVICRHPFAESGAPFDTVIHLAKESTFAAIYVCVFLCCGLTLLMSARDPSLIVATTLFGLNWAVLIPYYRMQQGGEVLEGFGFFIGGLGGLLTYLSALLLIQHAALRAGTLPDSRGFNAAVKWAPGFLGALVLPTQNFLAGLTKQYRFDMGARAEEVYGTFVIVLAFYLMWCGLKPYGTGRPLAFLRGTLWAYSFINIAHAAWFCNFYRTMPWFFTGAFVLLKIQFTVAYCLILGIYLVREMIGEPVTLGRLWQEIAHRFEPRPTEPTGGAAPTGAPAEQE
jgi:hypothetical protein